MTGAEPGSSQPKDAEKALVQQLSLFSGAQAEDVEISVHLVNNINTPGPEATPLRPAVGGATAVFPVREPP